MFARIVGYWESNPGMKRPFAINLDQVIYADRYYELNNGDIECNLAESEITFTNGRVFHAFLPIEDLIEMQNHTYQKRSK